MQKQHPQQIPPKSGNLNQFGRPKQQVVFYTLTPDMKKQAEQKLIQDKQVQSLQVYEKAKNDTQKVWDKFYKFHKCRFFKDRTYLEREIQPITLFKNVYQEKGTVAEFVELGCGVGNTLFPLLREYECFRYYGFDISAKAISLIEQQMQKHPEFKDRIQVSVANLVTDQIPYKGHGNLSTLIFVLSAIVPEKHQYVMQKISNWMQPGSFLYFRDYGRYDFGQLNLSSKGNRKLRDNFYMKNDGVCVYYFDVEEVERLFEKVGLVKIRVNNLCKLLQNRKRDLKMYRVWLQCLYYKPPIDQQMLVRLKEIQLMNQKNSQANNEQEQQQMQQTEHSSHIKVQQQKVEQTSNPTKQINNSQKQIKNYQKNTQIQDNKSEQKKQKTNQQQINKYESKPESCQDVINYFIESGRRAKQMAQELKKSLQKLVQIQKQQIQKESQSNN